MLVEGVPDRKAIGMLFLDCIKLKQVLMPSPLKCLDVSASNKTWFRFILCKFTETKINAVLDSYCFIM